MTIGTGDNGELTLLDWVALLSFFIALQNLDLNLDQQDKQDLENDLTKESQNLLDEIHGHLTDQDKKIDQILQILKERGGKNVDNSKD